MKATIIRQFFDITLVNGNVINNKVRVAYEGKFYDVKLAPFTKPIPGEIEYIDNIYYTLQVHSIYGMSIIPARKIDIIRRKELAIIGNPSFTPRINDMIHIYSREGIYTVIEIKNDFMTVTCKRGYGWTKTVPVYDAKCLHSRPLASIVTVIERPTVIDNDSLPF